MYSRRDVLKGLIIGGVLTSVVSTPLEAVHASVSEQNLLRNGSFEEDGFGRALSGWTVTLDATEPDS